MPGQEAPVGHRAALGSPGGCKGLGRIPHFAQETIGRSCLFQAPGAPKPSPGTSDLQRSAGKAGPEGQGPTWREELLPPSVVEPPPIPEEAEPGSLLPRRAGPETQAVKAQGRSLWRGPLQWTGFPRRRWLLCWRALWEARCALWHRKTPPPTRLLSLWGEARQGSQPPPIQPHHKTITRMQLKQIYL